MVYGARGWVCHVFTNAWGYTAPGWGLGWGMHPTGGIWIASDLWEHYLFTGDKEFLAQRAYPVLKEAAEFFLDYMVEHPQVRLAGHRSGHVARERLPRARRQRGAANRWGRRAIACWSMTCSPRASKRPRSWASTRTSAPGWKRPGPSCRRCKIGKHGQLQEWLEDFDEAKPNHRHTSHLAGPLPRQPNHARAPRPTWPRPPASPSNGALSQPNWEDVEWSRANLINFFARLGDGDQAHQHVLGLLAKTPTPTC